jgi:hypothetical protein
MEKVQEKPKSGIRFIKAGSLKAGEKISGRYEGQMEPDQFGKENFKIRASDDTLQVLNETSQLTNLLADIEVGTAVEIVYQGKITTNKGKSLHTFDVYADRSSASKAGPNASAPKKSALPF